MQAKDITPTTIRTSQEGTPVYTYEGINGQSYKEIKPLSPPNGHGHIAFVVQDRVMIKRPSKAHYDYVYQREQKEYCKEKNKEVAVRNDEERNSIHSRTLKVLREEYQAEFAAMPYEYRSYYKLCFEADWPILIMDYRGATLCDWSSREKNLTAMTLMTVFRLLAQELQKVHKHGYAHNDLKPENVCIKQDEQKNYQVRLIDFGISSKFREEPDYTFDSKGEYYHISPDLRNGSAKLEPRHDVYGLGWIYLQLANDHLKRDDLYVDADYYVVRELVDDMRKRTTADRLSLEQVIARINNFSRDVALYKEEVQWRRKALIVGFASMFSMSTQAALVGFSAKYATLMCAVMKGFGISCTAGIAGITVYLAAVVLIAVGCWAYKKAKPCMAGLFQPSGSGYGPVETRENTMLAPGAG